MKMNELQEMLKMWRQHIRLRTKFVVYEILEWEYGRDIFILDNPPNQ